MTWLLSLLGTSWAKIAAVGGIVLAILAASAKVFLAGRREGEDKARDAAQAAQNKAVLERQKVDETVGDLDTESVRRQLHNEWERPAN